jgi:hypothetical protein
MELVSLEHTELKFCLLFCSEVLSFIRREEDMLLFDCRMLRNIYRTGKEEIKRNLYKKSFKIYLYIA